MWEILATTFKNSNKSAKKLKRNKTLLEVDRLELELHKMSNQDGVDNVSKLFTPLAMCKGQHTHYNETRKTNT